LLQAISDHQKNLCIVTRTVPDKIPPVQTMKIWPYFGVFMPQTFV